MRTTFQFMYEIVGARPCKCQLLRYCLLCCTRWFLLLSPWVKPQCVAILKKAIEKYFRVVLFIMLYKVVLTFKSVDKTPVYDHSKESY